MFFSNQFCVDDQLAKPEDKQRKKNRLISKIEDFFKNRGFRNPEVGACFEQNRRIELNFLGQFHDFLDIASI